MSQVSNYRTTEFEGASGVSWLSKGWRALLLYGRRAKAAMEQGDIKTQAEMINRADRLLTIMSGILDTSDGAKLGQSLQTIYSALQFCLFKAIAEGSIQALDDYDMALSQLDRNFSDDQERTAA